MAVNGNGKTWLRNPLEAPIAFTATTAWRGPDRFSREPLDKIRDERTMFFETSRFPKCSAE
jgi:hypothetical protein